MVIQTRYSISINIFSFDKRFINQMWDELKIGRMFDQPVYGYFNLSDKQIDTIKKNAGPVTFSIQMSVPKNFFNLLISHMSVLGIIYSAMIEMENGDILSFTN